MKNHSKQLIEMLTEKIVANQSHLAEQLQNSRSDSTGRVYRPHRQGISPIERLASKLSITETECWQWTVTASKEGYGKFRATSDRKIPMMRVDLFIYQYLFGALENRLILEKTCGNRACCSPWHFLVVKRETIIAERRKPFCPQGHPQDERTIYINPNTGFKSCRICSNKAANLAERRRRESDPVYREKEKERRRVNAKEYYRRKKAES